jgi:hypothetical protein
LLPEATKLAHKKNVELSSAGVDLKRGKNELWLLPRLSRLAAPIQCHCIPGIHRHRSPALRNSWEVLSHVQSDRRIARRSWWESVLSSSAPRCENVSALWQRDQNTFVSNSKRESYTLGGSVCWPKADMREYTANVCFRGKAAPGCVTVSHQPGDKSKSGPITTNSDDSDDSDDSEDSDDSDADSKLYRSARSP